MLLRRRRQPVVASGAACQMAHALFDTVAVDLLAGPDGPQRQELINQAIRLSVAYMPLKTSIHGIETLLSHAHVVNYRPHPFMRDWFRFVDIDPPAA